MQYSQESAAGTQFNKKKINTPFVLGAIIELGNCLNLVESASLQIVSEAYWEMAERISYIDQPLPINKGNNKALDCAVFKYIHLINERDGKPPYDTIRCAFAEGGEVYPGSTISQRLHIQVCVMNTDSVKGYFLPKPLDVFNPGLK